MLLEQVKDKSSEVTSLALQLDCCRLQLKQLQESGATNDGIRRQAIETEKVLRETKELLSERTIETECLTIQNGSTTSTSSTCTVVVVLLVIL